MVTSDSNDTSVTAPASAATGDADSLADGNSDGGGSNGGYSEGLCSESGSRAAGELSAGTALDLLASGWQPDGPGDLDNLSDTLEFEPFELDEPPQQFASRRERRMADRSHGLKSPAPRARAGDAAVTAAVQARAAIGGSISGATRSVRDHRFVAATLDALNTARRSAARRFVRLQPSQRVLAAGVMVAIVAALAGIVAPVTIEKVRHTNAHAAYVKAASALEDARTAYSEARAAWDSRTERAEAEHDVFTTIERTLPASLVDPVTTHEVFVEANASFTAAADLVPTDDGMARAEPGFALPRPAPVADPSVATDHLLADTRELLRLAGITSAEANRLTQATQRIEDAYDTTVTSLDGLVTAAHSKGVTLSFEKASEETRLAFEKAVAALVAPIPRETSDGAADDDSDPEASTAAVTVTADDDVADALQITSERLAAYVDAHDAAKASHGEAVKAEEKRKKEERERQERDRRNSERSDDSERGDDSDRGDHDDGGQDHDDSDEGDRGDGSPPRGDVREGNDRCTGWGGSASAAWTDDINIPRDTSSWWIDDYSNSSTWTVYWTCSNW